MQTRPALIDGALVLKQVQAKIVAERLGLPYRREGAFPEDIADGGMLSFIMPPLHFLTSASMASSLNLADRYLWIQSTSESRRDCVRAFSSFS